MFFCKTTVRNSIVFVSNSILNLWASLHPSTPSWGASENLTCYLALPFKPPQSCNLTCPPLSKLCHGCPSSPLSFLLCLMWVGYEQTIKNHVCQATLLEVNVSNLQPLLPLKEVPQYTSTLHYNISLPLVPWGRGNPDQPRHFYHITHLVSIAVLFGDHSQLWSPASSWLLVANS